MSTWSSIYGVVRVHESHGVSIRKATETFFLGDDASVSVKTEWLSVDVLEHELVVRLRKDGESAWRDLCGFREYLKTLGCEWQECRIEVGW